MLYHNSLPLFPVFLYAHPVLSKCSGKKHKLINKTADGGKKSHLKILTLLMPGMFLLESSTATFSFTITWSRKPRGFVPLNFPLCYGYRNTCENPSLLICLYNSLCSKFLDLFHFSWWMWWSSGCTCTKSVQHVSTNHNFFLRLYLPNFKMKKTPRFFLFSAVMSTYFSPQMQEKPKTQAVQKMKST